MLNEVVISEIHKIEAEVFSDAWSIEAVRDSLKYDYNFAYVLSDRGVLYDKCHKGDVIGNIVGYITFSGLFEEGELLRIAVRKDERGKGYSKKLMDALVEKMREIKAEKVFLEVRSDNKAAIKLYYQYGFNEIGIRKNYYNDPVCDALNMECGLNN